MSLQARRAIAAPRRRSPEPPPTPTPVVAALVKPEARRGAVIAVGEAKKWTTEVDSHMAKSCDFLLQN